MFLPGCYYYMIKKLLDHESAQVLAFHTVSSTGFADLGFSGKQWAGLMFASCRMF